MIKKYLKCYGYLFGMIIILTLLLSIINYFVKVPANTISLIIPIISMLVGSFMLGKNTKEKAYLEGIKFSSIYIVLTIIFKLLMKMDFNYKVVIMYIAMLLTSIIGATIGINTKKGL